MASDNEVRLIARKGERVLGTLWHSRISKHNWGLMQSCTAANIISQMKRKRKHSKSQHSAVNNHHRLTGRENNFPHPFHSYQGPQTASDYSSDRKRPERPATQGISQPAWWRCVIQEGKFHQLLAGAFSGRNSCSTNISVIWISGPNTVSWHSNPKQHWEYAWINTSSHLQKSSALYKCSRLFSSRKPSVGEILLKISWPQNCRMENRLVVARGGAGGNNVAIKRQPEEPL